MKLWPFTSAAPAPTPSDAGRALNAARIAAQKVIRDQKTEQLRNCVRSGRIAHLGWRA